ncbi:hypothetical protein DD238_004849 [Peronospora effusa]|uniref:Uncharacterized protein n=1 Tax=Peronospora effusa TaxID=542832 RepID=A0A3M6VCA9_9STRA|nr:hypothetical protein DD238_004849 [Peronospora effusa]
MKPAVLGPGLHLLGNIELLDGVPLEEVPQWKVQTRARFQASRRAIIEKTCEDCSDKIASKKKMETAK